jgi:hypothetical protein
MRLPLMETGVGVPPVLEGAQETVVKGLTS